MRNISFGSEVYIIEQNQIKSVRVVQFKNIPWIQGATLFELTDEYNQTFSRYSNGCFDSLVKAKQALTMLMAA